MLPMPLGTIDESGDVAKPAGDFEDYAPRWRLARGLCGGTPAMQADALEEGWLPPFPLERDMPPGHKTGESLYDQRLRDSILLDAFGSAIRSICSGPFSRPLRFLGPSGEDARLPSELDAFSRDADMQGNGLTQFARIGLERAVAFGLIHVYVSATKKPKGATHGDIDAGRGRPKLSLISPLSMLDFDRYQADEWSPNDAPGGLNYVRFLEKGRRRGAPFKKQSCDQVRVVVGPQMIGGKQARGFWQVWRKNQNDEWQLEEQGAHGYPGVPVRTCYLNSLDFMRAWSPLDGLAYENLNHFRASSDHTQYAHFIRAASKYFRSGWDQNELDEQMILNPRHTAGSKKTGSDLKLIETTGAGLKCSAEDLRESERRMERMGAKPTMERSGVVTATSTALHYSDASTDALAFLEVWEQTLTEAVGDAHLFATGKRMPEGARFTAYRDWLPTADARESFKDVLELAKLGFLSHEDTLVEAQRLGRINEDAKIAALMERAKRDGPPGGSILNAPRTPGSDPDDDEADAEAA